MDSISDIILIGEYSTSLAGNYNSKGALFGGALSSPKSPVLIQMVTNALDWGNAGGAQTSVSLRGVANYLVWLCGKFGLTAKNSIGIGGGTVIPILPGALSASRIDFTVSASSSPMAAGDTTCTLSDFIGYNLDFVRGGISQSTLGTEASYFSFNRSTGAFVCFPALVTGEIIALIP